MMHISVRNKSYSTLAFPAWELFDDKVVVKGKEYPLDSLTLEASEEPHGIVCGYYRFYCKEKRKFVQLGFGKEELDAAHEAFEHIRSHLNKEETERLSKAEDTKNQIETLRNAQNTKKIADFFKNYVWFNDEYQQFVVFTDKRTPGNITPNVEIFAYSEILDYELIENGNSIAKGGLGSALLGVALFGEVGAIVGAVTGEKKIQSTLTELKIKVTLKSTSAPLVWINFASKEIKDVATIQSLRNAAQTTMSTFNVICSKAKKDEGGQSSAADEIRKFKSLLDDGIITHEEFELKKKELLGL